MTLLRARSAGTLTAVAAALLLQPAGAAAQSADLPVSLDRIRQGLEQRRLFDLPPPRPPGRPLFRTTVEVPELFEGEPWDLKSPIPLWARPSLPPVHLDFLASVTPPEVRASTLYPCCDVLPAVMAVTDVVGKGIKALKQRSARREVENAMRAAGIKR